MKKRELAALFFSILSAMLGLAIIAPVLPDLADKFKADGVWMGLMFTGFAISRTLVMPIVGKLSDKIGRKIFISSGLFLLVITGFLYLLTKNVYEFVGVRLIHGIAAGMILPIAMAYTGDLIKKGKEAVTMGMFNTVFYVGVSIGPLLGGILGYEGGINWLFYAMILSSALAFFVTVIFVPEVKKVIPKSDTNEDSKEFKEIIKLNTVKAILIITFITAFRMSTLISFMPSLAVKLNINLSGIGFLIFFPIFVSGILQTPIGFITDRLSRSAKLCQLIVGSLIGTAAMLSVPFCSNFAALLFVATLMGIGAAISVPVATGISVLIGKRVGMGSWMAIFNTTLSVGVIVAPITTGMIMDISGVDSIFYIIAGISLLVTLIGTYYVIRRLKGYRQG
ncbi:MAG: MFS transporter [Candidatus Omnitrophota bacterium]